MIGGVETWKGLVSCLHVVVENWVKYLSCRVPQRSEGLDPTLGSLVQGSSIEKFPYLPAEIVTE